LNEWINVKEREKGEELPVDPGAGVVKEIMLAEIPGEVAPQQLSASIDASKKKKKRGGKEKNKNKKIRSRIHGPALVMLAAREMETRDANPAPVL
jgi:hypothetical protein